MRGDGKTDRGGPERYGFLATILERFGADLPPDSNRLARWQASYAAARRVIHSEVFNEGEVPGYRVMAYQGSGTSVLFAGIRDDGVCVSGEVPYTVRYPRKPLGRPGVDLEDRAKGAAFCRAAAATVAGSPTGKEDMAALEGFGLDWDSTLPNSWFSFQTRARNFSESTQFLAHKVLEATLGKDWPTEENVLASQDTFGIDEEIPFEAVEPANPSKRAMQRVVHAMRAPVSAQQRKAGRFVVALLSRQAESEPLRRLRGLSISTPMAYNMLMGVPVESSRPTPTEQTPPERFAIGFGVPEPALARNRKQAVDMYPLFARTLLEGTGVDAAVDAGRPFEPELCARLGVPLALLKRFRGVTWQKAGRRAFHESAGVMSAYAELAPEHVPTTRAGFRALDAAVEAATGYVRSFPDTTRTVASVVASLGGRFERAAGWRDGADPRGAADASNDVMNRVVKPMVYQEALAMGFTPDRARQLAVDTRAHESAEWSDPFGSSGPQYPGFSPLGRDPGIRRAAEVSHAWHRAMFRLEADFADPSVRPSSAWKEVFGRRELGGGWAAEETKDPATMRLLGASEGHCVAGYAPKAEEGRCIITEMTKNGIRVSVLEVDTTAHDPKQWTVAQNRGKFNADPGKEATLAGQRLLRGLRRMPAEAWAAHRQVLNDDLSARCLAASTKDPDSALAHKVGYDPKDAARSDAAFRAMRGFMDKSWSGMDASAFRAAVVRPFVTMMDAELTAEEARKAAEVVARQEARAARAARGSAQDGDEPPQPRAAPQRPGPLARAAAAVRGFVR